jgi:hypothetical protein
MKIKIVRPGVSVTSSLSFLMGKYAGLGLMKNYPENFNRLIPEFANELISSITFDIDVDDKDVGKFVKMKMEGKL